MKPFGFPKSERLSSKKSIETIFLSGKSVFSFPIKAIFITDDMVGDEAPTQALFVVPKKRFKRAVDRNKIRRKIRENYRLKKHLLNSWCLENNKQIKIAFIYITSEHCDYGVIEKSIEKLIIEITHNQETNTLAENSK